MRLASHILAPSLIVVAGFVAGCGPSKSGTTGDSSATASATPAAPTGAGNAMIDSVEAHMRAMTSANASQLKTMLPAHRQTIANMISQMNQEMRSMNMPADAAWTATMDSLRWDLIHEPEMSSASLAASLPAHHARI